MNSPLVGASRELTVPLPRHSAGLLGSDWLALLSHAHPYNFTAVNFWVRLQLRLLEGAASPAYRLFKNNPFPDPARPPAHVRVSLYMSRPTSVRHWWATGKWWHVTHGGMHLPPVSTAGGAPAALWRVWDSAGPEAFSW
jgi:hypothetical protein